MRLHQGAELKGHTVSRNELHVRDVFTGRCTGLDAQGVTRFEDLGNFKKCLAAQILYFEGRVALLHKSEGRRDYPSPRRSYAMAPTGTVLGRPSCVKRLSRATRTCNSTTCRSNVRAITRWPRRLKQCILVSTRLLR